MIGNTTKGITKITIKDNFKFVINSMIAAPTNIMILLKATEKDVPRID